MFALKTETLILIKYLNVALLSFEKQTIYQNQNIYLFIFFGDMNEFLSLILKIKVTYLPVFSLFGASVLTKFIQVKHIGLRYSIH